MNDLPEIKLSSLPKCLHFDVRPTIDSVFNIRSDASGGVITIFDAIGGDVTASRISAALTQIGPRPVTLEINSPGGDYYEGVTIYNLLRKHPAQVTAQILGIAASAASVLAMGASRIEIARNAEIMIHRPSMVAIGPSDVMRQAAKILDGLDASLTETYALRTGQPAEDIAALMADETFLSSADAIELGFADALLQRDALPRPQVSNENTPASKRDLESRLRSVGLSKSEAARATAAAWPTLRRHDEDDAPLDLDLIAATVRRNVQTIGALNASMKGTT